MVGRDEIFRAYEDGQKISIEMWERCFNRPAYVIENPGSIEDIEILHIFAEIYENNLQRKLRNMGFWEIKYIDAGYITLMVKVSIEGWSRAESTIHIKNVRTPAYIKKYGDGGSDISAAVELGIGEMIYSEWNPRADRRDMRNPIPGFFYLN